MGQKINFTQVTIEQINPAPEGKRIYVYDTRVPGLQLQVTANGVKTFYVYRRVHGRPKRIKLGRFPDMKPAQARDQAKITLGKIAAGIDPNAQKQHERAAGVTLKQAFEEYLKVRSLKPKTEYNYKSIIKTAFPDWENKQLTQIKKDMVAKRHQKLGKDRGQATANAAMRVLRTIYNFASTRYEDDEGESLLPPNPVKRLSDTRAWFREKRRSTRIENNEIKPWFNAVLNLKTVPDDTFACTVSDYLLLLFFTGLRRQEAATMKWADVNLDNRTFTVRDTKNHEDHTLPLPDYLLELFSVREETTEGEYVFPGHKEGSHLIEPRNYVQKVIENSGVQFTLHDLRRTFLTLADSLDISAYALKRLVNHKMRNDITASYIVTDVERLRKPMQQITDYILSIVNKKQETVIPLAIEGAQHG